ncbi:MAG TPA: VTT domain-containing protein [Acidisphaera sp.]|nr:VTT domain-containing protein [Acidisphaera sp.]
MRTLRRRTAALIAVAGVAVLLWIAARWLNWQALGANEAALLRAVAAHPVLSAVAYVLVYALIVGFAVPVAALVTAAGGLLFGRWLGGGLAVAGGGGGAVLLFLIVRRLRGPAGAKDRMLVPAGLRARLARDGFSYLLAIRLLPVVPFWLVNFAGALSGMGLVPYALATFIGIAPVTFVLASIGAAAGDIIAAGHSPDFSVVTSPELLGPLVLLAVIALLPALLRRANA